MSDYGFLPEFRDLIITGGAAEIARIGDAIEALLNGLRSFATAVIWFGIVILPQLLLWAIVIAIPVVLVIWIVRRIRRRGNTTQDKPAQPPSA